MITVGTLWLWKPPACFADEGVCLMSLSQADVLCLWSQTRWWSVGERNGRSNRFSVNRLFKASEPEEWK